MIARARAVRWLPVALAAGAALWTARTLAPRATGAATRSFLAYRVAPGQRLSFPVAPGDRDLALTVQVEEPAPEGATPFRVSAVLEDAAGQERWRGAADLEAEAGATVVEDRVPATAPRALRLELPEADAGAQVTVTISGPRAAVLRLVRRVHRDALGGRRAADTVALGQRASLFGWAYLDEAARDVLLAEPLLRRSPADKHGENAALVHVRLWPRAFAPPPTPEPGEPLEGGRALAYTVRGPGRVRVVLDSEGGGPATAQLGTVDNHGAVSTRQVAAPGEVALDVPDVLTVTIAAPSEPLRVRAFVAGGATRLGGPPGDEEIAPDRRRLVLWRAHPAGPPVLATLAGDGSARVQLRPAGVGAARVRWRLFDAGGRVAAQGTMLVPAVPAPFERVRPEMPTTEPMALTAGGAPGGRLELMARDAPVDFELQAGDDGAAAEPAAGYAAPLERARLRYAPYARRRWVPFLPDNHAALEVSAGRVVLEGQVRLEPVAPGSHPAGPFRSIDPSPPRTGHLIAEVDDDGPRTGFGVGRAARVAVAGRGAGARRLVLDYHLGAEALGGTMRVLLDGRPAMERVVDVRRGRMRLGDVTPGEHEVEVDGAPGLLFTSAAAAGGAAERWTDRQVWRLDRGAWLTVPVAIRAQGVTLNVVLYSDQGVATVPAVTARVEIDGDRRAPGLRPARTHTATAGALRVAFEAIRSVWLDREAGARARARFAVRLGEDLGPGVHRVRVSVTDGPARLHARFFVTGRSSRPPVSFAGTEWAED